MSEDDRGVVSGPGDASHGGESVVPMLEVDELVKHFPVRTGLLRREVGRIRAVDGVSFALGSNETLGLVGESGSGKTTLGRALLRLVEPTSGAVRFRGEDVTSASSRRLRELRQHLQMVFQDPFASLNPRMPVRDAVMEPLVIQGASRAAARTRAVELFDAVGLPEAYGNRYPHQFSGGERQRVGIARALAPRPDVVVLDEPVSALDVSIRAQVINLLKDLQERFALSYLFISHDLWVVRHVADRVAVMYLGQIVELADRDRLYEAPAHPYTQALMSAAPIPDPDVEAARRRIVLRGEMPSAASPPSGCRFHTRCPLAQERCRGEVPLLRRLASGHYGACHFPLEPGERLVDRFRGNVHEDDEGRR